MWLIACVSAPDSARPAPDSAGSETVDSAPDTSGAEGIPGAAEAGACSDLFDPDQVRTYTLTLSEDTLRGLEIDYYNGLKDYHPATVEVDGESVSAQVRLKGNPDFSWFQAKMQYVVSFNEENPDARFHGLRKLAFDAAWYDPSLLRERVAWWVINTVGVTPSTCTASAQLDINGEPYGAYTLIEYYDHEWLERNFADAGATGTLWKYGSEAVANEEAADGSGLEALSRANRFEDFEAIGPAEEWAAAWAAEAALGDDDGYWCCAHNYYLYEHPTRGLLFAVWDLDMSLDSLPYDTDPVDGYPQTWGLFEQRPIRLMTEDPEGRASYREALAEVRAVMDPTVLEPMIDTWAASIQTTVELDTMRPFSLEEHEAAIVSMKTWIRSRGAYLDAWLACDAGQADDDDGDGHDDCSDPDDADAGVHPDATEICDGVDQDADGVIDDDPSCDDCTPRSFEGNDYLFCRGARTYTEAVARCAQAGLAPLDISTTADFYYVYLYTWPVDEDWYLRKSGAQCRAWATFSTQETNVDCGEAHPVICGGG